MNNKYSNYKIAWFPEKLKSFINKEITAPIYVRIKPTNRCCHNCYFCVYNYSFSQMHDSMERIDEIPFHRMLEIIDDLKNTGVKAITYSGGGEPLIYKNILEIFNKTLESKIDLSLLTNGQYMSGKIAEILTQAKWIRVSLNYWNEQLFIKTRKRSRNLFYDIIDNMTNFSKMNKSCDFGINYIITKENYTTLIEAFETLALTGIDNIRFSPVWVPNFFDYHKKIERNVKSQLDKIHSNNKSNIKVYDSYHITQEAKKREYDKCYFSQIVPVIGADQNIYTCHNKAYDPKGIIGSIKGEKFSKIWFSENTKKFFENFKTSLCKHQCANDTKNIIINEIVNCHGDNYV